MTTETTTTQATTTTEGAATSPATETTATASAAAADGGTTQDAGSKTEQPGDGKAAATAPEKYEFKAPEGREYDPDVIGKFSEIAKELNLTQDGAQKMIDKLGEAFAAKQERAQTAAKNEWTVAAKADKEFGGDALEENLGIAKKALEAFGTPELRTMLDATGLGDHPEMIRAFYRAGKAISEDGRFVSGRQGAQAPQSLAQRMYPGMNP